MSLAHEKWPDKTKPMTNMDVIDLYIKHKPKPYFQANSGFHYCNTNYALLASVVEKVSGMSFDRFVKMNVFFRPLHMANSFVYNHRFDSIVPFYPSAGYQVMNTKAGA